MPNIQGIPVSEDVAKLNEQLCDFNATPSLPASKYHNTKTEFRGLRFQSGHEAGVVSQLIMLEEKHLIFGLRLQVRFPLYNDEVYVADATYADEVLGFHVIDAKGMRTRDYLRKKKLFCKKYGKEITEI